MIFFYTYVAFPWSVTLRSTRCAFSGRSKICIFPSASFSFSLRNPSGSHIINVTHKWNNINRNIADFFPINFYSPEQLDKSLKFSYFSLEIRSLSPYVLFTYRWRSYQERNVPGRFGTSFHETLSCGWIHSENCTSFLYAKLHIHTKIPISFRIYFVSITRGPLRGLLG